MLLRAPPTTRKPLSEKAVQDISRALIPLLSDAFALYLKTKNFHWHMSGPHYPRLSFDARRSGRAAFLHDGRYCRESQKAGRHYRSLHWSDFALTAHRGQRR